MRNRPDTVMIFAAGRGTRMAPLTDRIPKPLIQVAGRPLIDHALAVVQTAGLGRIVVNTHHLANQMDAYLPRHILRRHEPDLLETGGGLKAALPIIDRKVLFTLNSDAVWTGDNPLDELAALWNPDIMDALVLLAPRDSALGHNGAGDFIPDDQGRLRRGPGMVFLGAQIIKADPVARQPEDVFSMNRVWDAMIAEGRLFGAIHHGHWCDVGHPAGIVQAEEMLRSHAL